MSGIVPSSNLTNENAEGLVLIAEDEFEIAEILIAYLDRAGLKVAYAADGRRALEMHQMLKPDIILLDVNMPKINGWQVLTEIRQRSDTPIIMLTAMDQDIDKLMGLRIGADDYVVKPFNPAEVVARTQAVLRRTMALGERLQRRILRVAPLQIDLDNHEVKVQRDGKKQLLSLTLTEFKLLAHLAHMPRRVCSRTELLEACLPESDALERTVDSHVSKLRRKLEDAGVEGMPIGVRGIGYKLRGEQ